MGIKSHKKILRRNSFKAENMLRYIVDNTNHDDEVEKQGVLSSTDSSTFDYCATKVKREQQLIS